jgi:GT2 family glycosyltransferase
VTPDVAPAVTVVVLAYGEEPHLASCVESALASTGVRVTVVLVDNGCSNPRLDECARDRRVQLVRPARNLGYAAGCNVGAAATPDPTLVFLNSDCLVADDAVAALTAGLQAPGVGLVTASVRLAATPGLLNSAGNPVHFLGFSWAGRCGEPARSPELPADVASISGACFGVRRELWQRLGGFEDQYFAYHEDVDLSLRCWLAGLSVRYVPGAVAQHHYHFSRHAQKMYLLERNRLVTWLTVLERRTLVLLAPALLLAELATALLAARQGWLRHKVRAWWWLLRRVGWLQARRRVVQQQRRCPDRVLGDVLTPVLRPGGSGLSPAVARADAPLTAYWKAVRRCL